MRPITRLQIIAAFVSLAAAIIITAVAFIVDPTGEIHDSILYVIAQFLLLTASLFGVGAVFSHHYNDEDKK